MFRPSDFQIRFTTSWGFPTYSAGCRSRNGPLNGGDSPAPRHQCSLQWHVARYSFQSGPGALVLTVKNGSFGGFHGLDLRESFFGGGGDPPKKKMSRSTCTPPKKKQSNNMEPPKRGTSYQFRRKGNFIFQLLIFKVDMLVVG